MNYFGQCCSANFQQSKRSFLCHYPGIILRAYCYHRSPQSIAASHDRRNSSSSSRSSSRRSRKSRRRRRRSRRGLRGIECGPVYNRKKRVKVSPVTFKAVSLPRSVLYKTGHLQSTVVGALDRSRGWCQLSLPKGRPLRPGQLGEGYGYGSACDRL